MGTERYTHDETKEQGARIMVLDFIDEYNGFLSLTDDEYQKARETNPSVRKYAHEFLELTISGADEAIRGIKYPKSAGWRHV